MRPAPAAASAPAPVPAAPAPAQAPAPALPAGAPETPPAFVPYNPLNPEHVLKGGQCYCCKSWHHSKASASCPTWLATRPALAQKILTCTYCGDMPTNAGGHFYMWGCCPFRPFHDAGMKAAHEYDDAGELLVTAARLTLRGIVESF